MELLQITTAYSLSVIKYNRDFAVENLKLL